MILYLGGKTLGPGAQGVLPLKIINNISEMPPTVISGRVFPPLGSPPCHRLSPKVPLRRAALGGNFWVTLDTPGSPNVREQPGQTYPKDFQHTVDGIN